MIWTLLPQRACAACEHQEATACEHEQPGRVDDVGALPPVCPRPLVNTSSRPAHFFKLRRFPDSMIGTARERCSWCRAWSGGAGGGPLRRGRERQRAVRVGDAGILLDNVPRAARDPLGGEQALDADRAARVDAPGADAHLRTQNFWLAPVLGLSKDLSDRVYASTAMPSCRCRCAPGLTSSWAANRIPFYPHGGLLPTQHSPVRRPFIAKPIARLCCLSEVIKSLVLPR